MKVHGREIPVTKYSAATSSWGSLWAEAAWGKKCMIFHVPLSICYQRQHFRTDGLTLAILQVWLFLPYHRSSRLMCWVFWLAVLERRWARWGLTWKSFNTDLIIQEQIEAKAFPVFGHRQMLSEFCHLSFTQFIGFFCDTEVLSLVA